MGNFDFLICQETKNGQAFKSLCPPTCLNVPQCVNLKAEKLVKYSSSLSVSVRWQIFKKHDNEGREGNTFFLHNSSTVSGIGGKLIHNVLVY